MLLLGSSRLPLNLLVSACTDVDGRTDGLVVFVSSAPGLSRFSLDLWWLRTNLPKFGSRSMSSSSSSVFLIQLLSFRRVLLAAEYQLIL